MRLIFLGTGGYHPSDRRHTSGILFPDLGLLLDAGTGTYRVAEHLRQRELTIAITHAHLDHVCGLTYLLVPLQTGVISRLRIVASAAVMQTVREHLFAPALFPVLPPAEFITLEEGAPIGLSPEVTLAHLSPSRVTLAHQSLPGHPGTSRAYRLDWTDDTGTARRLACVTDTTVDGSYTDFIRNADLLIHECYFHDDDRAWAARTGHTHTSEVAMLAREANVGRLVLTHIDPQRHGDDPIGIATARAIFPNTTVAEDLMECEV